METCCCYPKDQVYPASGGEFQLEQLRAVLPQYKVTLPIAEDDSCDMEMTVAYTANISTMIPSSGTREYDEGFSRMLVQGGNNESLGYSSSTSTLKDEPSFRESEVVHQQGPPMPVTVPLFLGPMPQAPGNKMNPKADRLVDDMAGKLFPANQESERGLRSNLGGENGRRRSNLENERSLKPSLENAHGHRSNLENERGRKSNLENQDGRRSNLEKESGRRSSQENVLGHKQEAVPYGRHTAKTLENSHRQTKQHQPYGFTPSSMQGSTQLPSFPAGVSTKLNFSEMESSILSMSSHQHSMQAPPHQATEGSMLSSSKAAPRKHLLGFNVSSDLEAKAKVLMETKQNSENEFAMTEFEVPKKPGQLLKNRKVLGALDDDLSYLGGNQPPASSMFSESQESFSVYADSMVSADESSFMPFQDASCISMRVGQEGKNLSRSYGGNPQAKENSIFSHSYGAKALPLASQSRPSIGKTSQLPAVNNRKVLQEIPVPSDAVHSQHLPEYAMPQSSFSVYGTTAQDESSFLPYYDANNMSMAGQENPPPPAPPPSLSSSAATATHQSSNVPSSVLGGVFPPGEFLETTLPQGLTQFDIKHPSTYDPVSTPASHKSLRDLSFNLSVISVDLGRDGSRHFTQPLTTKPMCLSTITEESSGKSKLTVSSSRSRNTTNTTSSSTTNSLGSGTECDPSAVILDPFEPGTVNRMLNCLGGITPELVEEMAPDESLSVVEGECLQLGGGGVVYDSMAVLPQKGDYPHSTMYQCSSGLNTPHMLQVFKSGGEWAVTAAHHCQNRLLKKELGHMAEAFPEFQQVCLYLCPDSVTVTVSHYHRYGSILDLLECVLQRRVFFTDVVVAHLCSSMLGAVATLHKAGFLHTNISPRHFLLHDISDPKFAERPSAVRLIDFKHCVDMYQFNEDQLFTGCPTTQQDPNALWRCPIMKEGKHWKWQVDYYSLAMSILTLVQRNDPCVTQDPQTGRYCCPKLNRNFDTPLWYNLLDQLLNAEGWIDLDQLKDQLLSQVTAIKIKSHFLFLAKKL